MEIKIQDFCDNIIRYKNPSKCPKNFIKGDEKHCKYCMEEFIKNGMKYHSKEINGNIYIIDGVIYTLIDFNVKIWK